MLQSYKKIGLAVLLTVVGVFTANAQSAAMWKIDKAHTSVNFSVNHFFTPVTGKFTNFDGTINFDPDNLKGSKGDFSIAVKSINTENDKRNKHLQSPDFFDAKSFPNITFKSTKIEKKSETEYSVHGKLTIKDKTKNIVLPLKITGKMEHPMMKGTTLLGLTANLKINRNDYGVGTGDWAATVVVGDEVDININMELSRKN